VILSVMHHRQNPRSWASFWETAIYLLTEEFPYIFMCRLHKRHPLVPILSQISTARTTPYYLLSSILILSTHLRLGLPSGLFPSDFPTNIPYWLLLYPVRAACPVHLIILNLTLIIVGEVYKLWRTSLCSFLKPSVTSCTSHHDVHKTPSAYILPLISETTFRTHAEPQSKL
jgi:hypothetical protein